MKNLVTELELVPFLRSLADANDSFDEERLMRAFSTACESYAEEKHWTGVSLLEHCIGVLEVLLPFEPDEDAIIACLLHHVLHTKSLSLLELEEQFGSKVRSLASGVHLLSHVTLERRRGTIEDLRLMLLSVSDDMRVLLITLCDRCHCLGFLDNISVERRRLLCGDVLQLFAPVTARLGIYSIKYVLENHAFPVIYPNDAERIDEQLAQMHRGAPDFLDHATDALKTFLHEQGVGAEVEAREKHPYSIFLKMQRKSLTDVQHVHDLFALRVIVPREEDCYQVLGLLHRMGKPVENRFKDYIAFPKPNGYQSLHTTLAQFAGVPDGVFIEVQVRTVAMHREAQFGVAAHWSYREHGPTQQAVEKVQLHTMLISQQEVEEESKTTLVDHIFVLTPMGDIVELPDGATPLDFAFQVHTDLGLSFRSARVNGSIVSLDYQLENGDIVDVQKYRTARPSPQWIQQLKIASSRSQLKKYFYAQERPQLITKGRDLVNEELKKRKLSPLDTGLSLLRKCDEKVLSVQQREDLLFKVGQGSEPAAALLPRLDVLKMSDVSVVNAPKKSRKKHPRLQRKDALIGMEGNLSMPLKYAQCCTPAEGAHGNIIGNINRMGEVMVHRSECRMLGQRNKNPERRVKIWWK